MEHNRHGVEVRILSGGPRNVNIPSLRCVADPEDNYLGSFFFEKDFVESLKDGVFPSGSLWINDHNRSIFEVLGIEGEDFTFHMVGRTRLRLLESRFPRLKRAISNAQVS